eukprot:CAMPEP_0117513988 /NCGR_PEP_ID=MMETSP0784-20121206/29839_1 /TAXON_ID=39447 /ORGANISM="" /LENGTH=578 /DNA_ID=CAMNT_0005309773 /DNA_START=94 /DNA_END=1830 /DNA_ORIENTATION=-
MRERPAHAPTSQKAYKNEEFLNGPHARLLRIQCEFEEPRVRLEAHNVESIIMIFGSARSKPPEAYEKALEELREKVKVEPELQPQLTRLDRMKFLCRYHDETVKLAKLITDFSMERQPRGLPTYTVGTGAGPGMMEAANEGAWRAGGQSVGFGISLPFEKGLNPFVTPQLGFEFHYFFTRKFWMAYRCMGLVVAPGGYGTCDELFEILTLMASKKIGRTLPVVLFGEKYWTQVLKLDVMEEHGVITPDKRKMVYICDTAEDAFAHLQEFWQAFEAKGVAPSPSHKAVYNCAEPPLKKLRIDSDPPMERPMPPKAYKNMEFIKSHHSRIFRIQCEMEETRHRMEAQDIGNTLMFVGSGSVKTYEDHLAAVSAAAATVDTESGKETLQHLAKQQPLLKYHQVARDLARRITAWSMTRHKEGKAAYHVATGGGPGMAEAANEGAWEAGGKSLAFSGGGEKYQHFNRYVTPELAFVFHYFFTRKFWMAYRCKGMVALPGGFGTCDELFEILTLIQTGKIEHKIPIVLVGVDYWKRAICWEKMAEYGMISDDDVKQLVFTDSAEEACNYIVSFWEKSEMAGRA